MRTQLREMGRTLPAAQLAVRMWRRRARRPRWADVAGTPIPDKSGTRVLVATSVGGHLTGLTLESALAAALAVRGADVEALLCDAALPACLECTVVRLGAGGEMADHGPRRMLCPGCFRTGQVTYGELGVPVQRYSSWLGQADRDRARQLARETPAAELSELVLDGVAIGEHALAGTLRHFARADLDGEARAQDVLRRYVEAAVLTACAVGRLLDERPVDVVLLHHGIYVPQGLIAAVARHRSVRVVTWNPAYRKNCFIFSHEDTYHHTLLDEPVSAWEDAPWDQERITDYLASRWSGAQDWIWFHQSPQEDARLIEEECGVDFSRPTIGLLTNVMWDAQLHYRANAFKDMLAWIVETVTWFASHPSLQLLIRVHPAEIRGTVPSRQRVVDELRARFPALPPNVFVLAPESSASTYVAMAHCDSALIYGTKTGVELTAMGIPTIVAGEAWIRGKGVTIDVEDRLGYIAALESLPIGHRLDDKTRRRALQYAYHFFFRRMMPLNFVEPTGSDPVFRLVLEDVAELTPGCDAGLDQVCAGILEGSPFVHTADDPSSYEDDVR